MQILTEKDNKEKKSHGNYAFPVNVSWESISQYEGGAFLWHWHPEIELTWVRSGKMIYKVNEHTYTLAAGQGLFCNSSMLHSGQMIGNEGCDYLSITFHPRFLYGYEQSILQVKYMDFITENSNWNSLLLDGKTDWQDQILTDMKEIEQLASDVPPDYELRIHRLLDGIWYRLYEYYAELPEDPLPEDSHLDRLKSILNFLKEHYADSLTLDDIAAHVGLCKSECCRFFKKHMGMTLFDYLLFYRIQQSLPLLKEGESVTTIASRVGFSSSAYYSKLFRRYMNCSPREYKRNT